MATASGAIATTVIAAVNSSIGSIDTIINWVNLLENFSQQYAEAGETIRDIKVTAFERRAQLRRWRDMWNIEESAKYPYQEELWGDTQLRVIRGKICTIEDLCSKFNEELQQVFKGGNNSQLLQTIAQRNIPISTSQRLSAFRNDARDSVRDASASQIISFVINLKPRAIDWQSRLKEMLAELEAFAAAAFFVKHREKVSDGLTPEQLEKIKRSTFLGMAVELRRASEKLFRSCLEAKQFISQENGEPNSDGAHTRLNIDMTGIQSGIDLENVPSQSGIQVLFHLVLDWERLSNELCIEGPLLDPEQVRNIGSFVEAYKAIRRNEEATILVEPNLLFASRTPNYNEAIEQRNLDDSISHPRSLTELLHALDEPGVEPNAVEFPRTQRLSLASKIVECGLFLAGTSWLSSLRSRSVRRSLKDSTSYCFTLDANNTIQNASGWILGQLAEDMVRIGVILMELGIGELIWGVRRCGSGMLDTEEYLVCEPGADHKKHGKWMSVAAIMDELKTTMSSEYASATAHCLGKMRNECIQAVPKRAQNDIRDTHKKLFDDYFINIYTP
jgi:hypothetical protein